MTDYLTKTVSSTVDTTDLTLRQAIEHPYFDVNAPPNAPALRPTTSRGRGKGRRYRRGAQNAYSAFFLGEIEPLRRQVERPALSCSLRGVWPAKLRRLDRSGQRNSP